MQCKNCGKFTCDGCATAMQYACECFELDVGKTEFARWGILTADKHGELTLKKYFTGILMIFDEKGQAQSHAKKGEIVTRLKIQIDAV